MKHFLKSLYYALKGIRTAFLEQANFKIHFVVALIVVFVGYYFRITSLEWIIIVFAIGFVFAAELFNTAIEYIVNMISPEHQPTAGKIKDIAAGAVFVTAITAGIIGVIIFKKYILG